MRTKTYIAGFKNSQKIRVIIDGFGVYTTVSGVATVYATHSHRQAANDGLMRLSYMRYMAVREGELIPTGVGMTSYNTTQKGMSVQVDLI
jgi:hypothetical protein